MKSEIDILRGQVQYLSVVCGCLVAALMGLLVAIALGL